MNLSIIIPTHNRCNQLNQLLANIEKIKDEVDTEVVIVDNNSTDNTKLISHSFAHFSKYVFEPSTSFSVARKTGFENSSGDILVFIDDDIEICEGSLREIRITFEKHKNCGVIASQIMPKFLSLPPDWCLACQKTFNGWSLYNPEQIPDLYYGFQEVTWGAGPMLAISRRSYEESGGFPPDTIGVETNTDSNLFKKLYIGPGDYGLCYKVIENGKKVFYNPEVKCYHIIPPIRFTNGFWRSRMIGEGHHAAITDRMFFKLSNINLKQKYLQTRRRLKNLFEIYTSKQKTLGNIGFDFVSALHSSELYVHYCKGYLEMHEILEEFPKLKDLLWEIGANGIKNNDFERIIRCLPKKFLEITSPQNFYIEGNLFDNQSYINSIYKLTAKKKTNYSHELLLNIITKVIGK